MCKGKGLECRWYEEGRGKIEEEEFSGVGNWRAG